MEKSLFPDDFVLVSKFKYGPKVPNSFSEIPWINILYNDKEQNHYTKNLFCWNDKRLRGTTSVKNNDIIVFSSIKNDKNIIKRCIATPGDTLVIRDNSVYINSKILHNDNVIFETSSLNSKKIYTNSKGFIKDNNYYDQVYPKSKYHHWSSDNYGPYVIPKKKMSINLTPVSYALYSEIIHTHENSPIKMVGDSFYLNKKKTATYTFKNNYYFLMGDNRGNSKDSRYWGLLPENNIIGKFEFVLFSFHNHKFRYDRLFRQVN